MTIPAYKDVDLALLVELVRSPVPMRRTEALARVVRHFPELTEEDVARTRADGRTKAFSNMVNWGRNHLRVRGLLDLGGGQGIWRANDTAQDALIQDLVQRGVVRDRAEQFVRSDESLSDLLGRAWARAVLNRAGGMGGGEGRRGRGRSETRIVSEPISGDLRQDQQEPLRTARTEGDREWAEQQLVARLNALAGYEFEQLIARVLDGLGFRDTQVTGRSGDEGVDLITQLWSPLVSATVAVQVKRHSGNVGPRDISYLRDRWAHRADRLMFITTSDFTAGAREVAEEDRDKVVELVNGKRLVAVMIEHGLGVRSEPTVTYQLDEDYFAS